MKAFTLLLWASIACVSALDIQLDSFTCDNELPFYALGIEMYCSDSESARCTFGSTSTFSGKLQYNGTADHGVSADGMVYGKAGLQLMTLDYDLFNGVSLYMCGPWTQQVDENDAEAYENANSGRYLADAGDDAAQDDAAQDDVAQDDAVQGDDGAAEEGCATDGVYTFYVDLDLPENDENLSWLATGWKGVGDVAFFSQAGESSSLVGYCQIKFKTFVTPQEEYFYMPSALIVSLAIIALCLCVMMTCCYCRCCRSAPVKKKTFSKKRSAVKETTKSTPPKEEKKPERSANDHKFDPIEMARSTSQLEENAAYHYMDDKRDGTLA